MPPKDVKLRCPYCRHAGVFHPSEQSLDAGWLEQRRRTDGIVENIQCGAGIRICPNPDCRGIILVHVEGGKLVSSLPSELIDFDATALPQAILSSIEEALKCHAAGAYKASALMIRRVLEEVCKDKGATGGNLKDRLSKLSTSIIIPSELLAAADELRILGNDAAHVEAQAYDDIGIDESGLAIDMAKEILKATYQYASLVERLKALKKVAR
ncbi:protein of unknown function [Kaistia soli DSM 19436]|uniref:DUF4145 domain-containing protein n=1 Tax=Kaistia soli DSM 19436 TaxID=1122133 RepID=A0A1M5D2L7_9HYPH|nr:DUF4145 domain-containing protein [Kaistia soli]SHF61115.1 protein of unknown function [Kaistia soli DSM 19436]